MQQCDACGRLLCGSQSEQIQSRKPSTNDLRTFKNNFNILVLIQLFKTKMSSTGYFTDSKTHAFANESAVTEADYMDNEHHLEVCAFFDFFIEAVLMGLLCAFGFVGNSLSTVCLLRDRSKSATPFLLVSLEIADTLFLMSVLMVRVATTLAESYADDLPLLADLVPYIGKFIYPFAMVAETGNLPQCDP
jgi:hypothetical protein